MNFHYIQGTGQFPSVRNGLEKYFSVPTTGAYWILFRMNGKQHIAKAVCKFYYGTKPPFKNDGAEGQILDRCGRIKMCISPHQVEAWFYSKKKEKKHDNSR